MWQLHLQLCLSKSFQLYQYLLFRNFLLLSFSKSKVHSYFLLHIPKFSLFFPSEKKVEHIVSWCCHLWLFVMSTALVTWVRTQLLFSEPRISCNTDYQQYDDSGLLSRVKYQNSISRYIVDTYIYNLEQIATNTLCRYYRYPQSLPRPAISTATVGSCWGVGWLGWSAWVDDDNCYVCSVHRDITGWNVAEPSL